jgi:glyoxylase-like metal-dependent hydrolase (beta-lactamase superfamily II)
VGGKIDQLRVVGLPGNPQGEVAFYWSERKPLVVGDAVIGNPPRQLRLLRESVMDEPARLRVSMRQLLSLDFDTLLVGDGAVCSLRGEGASAGAGSRVFEVEADESGRFIGAGPRVSPMLSVNLP